MKLKLQFIFYLVFLHAVIAFFAFDYFLSQKYWFLLIEAGLVISFFFAFRIYRHLVRPLDLITSGIQSIKDRDFTINYRKVHNKELDELIDVFNGMIDRLREERTIQQEQHFFLQKLMEAAPVGIIILDGNDRIRQVNKIASRMLKNLPEILTGQKPEEIQSPFASHFGDLAEDEQKTLRINGINSFRITRTHFMNLGFRNSFILIDELTNEVLAAEKEAFGKAIRMMSHEVNNSIGATNSILQTLKTIRQFTDDGQHQKMESAIDIIMERNTNLNRFMNNLADVIRLPSPTIKTCDLIHHVQTIANLMQPYCLAHQVTLTLSLPTHPYLIGIDAGQIEQLLVNVIKNAVEAIVEKGEITITLDSEKHQLRIEDTGKGIPREIEKKIFTPFYSSKKNGQGIGLTVTREIAHKHGFGVSLQNRSGGGAVFSLSMK